MKKVRWGILGTANHAAKILIPALQASASGTVAAVASRDAERAREFAAAHGIPASYGSYEALLADPEIDAVYIPLPNHLHRAWAIRAAEAGKHTLCEKPLALNAAEAGEMVAAFRAAGLRFAEAFQWRHHPQDQAVRAMVRAGQIGTLRLINAVFSFMLDRPGDIRWDAQLGGGALYDVGCYPISVARYVVGAEPLAVTAQAHWNAGGVDDLLTATLEFPDGVLAHMDCAFVLPLRRAYDIVGTDGVLRVEYAYNPVADRPGKVVRLGADQEVLETVETERVSSYTLMVEDFNRAVLDDRDPLFPAEDGVANMRVIDAIFKAVREGRRVEVAAG